MKIEKLEVGFLKENCYILTKNNESLIIDPGDEAEKIKEKVKGKVVGIIITHHHFDHVGALEELLKYYKTQMYDIYNLQEGENSIGDFTFEVIYTPGHKEDLISILMDNKLFCGDFIFLGTIGRYDLPGSNFEEMKKSLRKIIKYDKSIIIYPGHGKQTTLEDELETIKSYLK